MNLRDAYLAYQAEIGTEEVVLAQPLIRKAVAVETQTATAATTATTTPSPSFASIESPNFFQSISDSLKAQPAFSKPMKKETLAAPTLVAVPEFKDLAAYWKFLDEEYPRWFSTSSQPVRSEGLSNPVLAIVEMSPELSATPKVFDGATGVFLDKMMKAIGLDRSHLYLTSLMKTPPPTQSWARKDVARMLPFFMRELQLAACPIVLLLGEACAQSVLRTGKNLSSLSRQIFEAGGLTFAASHHPLDLEMNQDLKREAWEDLKWLKPRLGSVS